jgi:hypothetical protein
MLRATFGDDDLSPPGSRCSICNCNLPLKVMGHNSEPVAPGVCCVICNYTIVIPERMRMIENAS